MLTSKALIGRDDVLSELSALLTRAQAIAIVGPPGVGKSALIDALTHEVSVDHVVLRVDLHHISSEEGLAHQLSRVLRHPLDDGEDLLLALELHHHTPTTLILDGLSAASTWVTALIHALKTSPKLRLWITSRVPLEQNDKLHQVLLAGLAVGESSASYELFNAHLSSGLALEYSQVVGPLKLTDGLPGLIIPLAKLLNSLGPAALSQAQWLSFAMFDDYQALLWPIWHQLNDPQQQICIALSALPQRCSSRLTLTLLEALKLPQLLTHITALSRLGLLLNHGDFWRLLSPLQQLLSQDPDHPLRAKMHSALAHHLFAESARYPAYWGQTRSALLQQHEHHVAHFSHFIPEIEGLDALNEPALDHALCACFLLAQILSERGPSRWIIARYEAILNHDHAEQSPHFSRAAYVFARLLTNEHDSASMRAHYLERAMLHARRHHDQEMVVYITYAQAILWIEYGESTRGLSSLQECLEQLSVDHPLRGFVLSRYARHMSGDVALRDRKLEEALTLFTRQGDVYGECIILLDMSSVYTLRGHHQLAHSALSRVQDLLPLIFSDALESSMWLQRARHEGRQAQWRLAQDAAQRSLDAASRVGNLYTMLHAALDLGLAQLKLNHLDAAMALSWRWSAIARRVNRPHLITMFELLQLMLRASLGELEQALLRYQELEQRSSPQASVQHWLKLAAAHLELLRTQPMSVAVHVSGDWIWSAEQGMKKVKHRKSLHGILRCLTSSAGPVSLEALIQAGWPDERLQEEHGKNRLHVALNTLRSLGLNELIVLDAQGYSLSSALPRLYEPLPSFS